MFNLANEFTLNDVFLHELLQPSVEVCHALHRCIGPVEVLVELLDDVLQVCNFVPTNVTQNSVQEIRNQTLRKNNAS